MRVGHSLQWHAWYAWNAGIWYKVQCGHADSWEWNARRGQLHLIIVSARLIYYYSAICKSGGHVPPCPMETAPLVATLPCEILVS